MTPSRPLRIYITTPAYNREDTLGRTVRSVLSQDYDEWRLIITDDGSTDGTAGVAKEFVRQYPEKVAYFYQENGGLGSARNAGIERVLADSERRPDDLVLPLDSDDELQPGGLRALAETSQKHPDSGLLILGAAYADGRKCYSMREPERALTFPEFVSGDYVSGECIAGVQVRVFENPAMRNDPALNGGDGLVWWRIAKTTTVACADRLVRVYHTDAANTMSRETITPKKARELYEVNRRTIDEFGGDLRRYNPRQLGTLYLSLARMAALTGRKAESLRYLVAGMRFRPFDFVRIGMYLVSLVDSRFFLNNLIGRYFAPRSS